MAEKYQSLGSKIYLTINLCHKTSLAKWRFCSHILSDVRFAELFCAPSAWSIFIDRQAAHLGEASIIANVHGNQNRLLSHYGALQRCAAVPFLAVLLIVLRVFFVVVFVVCLFFFVTGSSCYWKNHIISVVLFDSYFCLKWCHVRIFFQEVNEKKNIYVYSLPCRLFINKQWW